MYFDLDILPRLHHVQLQALPIATTQDLPRNSTDQPHPRPDPCRNELRHRGSRLEMNCATVGSRLEMNCATVYSKDGVGTRLEMSFVYLCWCICWDMHCEARRLCLHTFNYAGAFVGEARRICLHTRDYAGAFVGEARRICLHTFDYAGAFVGICIVGPGTHCRFVFSTRQSLFCIFNLHALSFCIFNLHKVTLCILNLHIVPGTKQVVVFPSKRQAKGNAEGHQHTGTRSGWVHFLQVSTIWAIACRAYLEMTK